MTGLIKTAQKIFTEEGFVSFARKGFLYVMQLISIPFCRKHINGFKYEKWQDAVQFGYARFWGLLRPAQVKWEISELIQRLDQLKPRILMEIGTMNGGTLFLFTRIADPHARLLSLDLPWGQFGYGYPKNKIKLYQTFARETQKLELIRANSHDQKSVDRVREILKGEKLDFLFLDGDHTYAGVKQDFEMYSPFVKNGGLIGFHDIAPHPPETGCDVYRFWNEIVERFPGRTEAIVENWEQGWSGIGLLNWQASSELKC